jgi:hypothetical protein
VEELVEEAHVVSKCTDGRRHGPSARWSGGSISAVATAVGQDSELQILANAKRQRWWEGISPTVVGCVVAVVLALWSTAGAWGGRPPHGEDVMSYLVRADFALPHLVAHGRLDGGSRASTSDTRSSCSTGPA